MLCITSAAALICFAASAAHTNEQEVVTETNRINSFFIHNSRRTLLTILLVISKSLDGGASEMDCSGLAKSLNQLRGAYLGWDAAPFALGSAESVGP